MSTIYKWINPPIKYLLRSPLHGLMSSNTLLLEFTGRKSGRNLSTPISYHIQDGGAHCFTSQSFHWWRNLTNGQTVTLTIAGQAIRTEPEVVTENMPVMEAALGRFLSAVPRDASHSGVQLDPDGHPNEADIKRVVPGMV